MTKFYDAAKQHQIEWRFRYHPQLRERGMHGGRQYPHLLPARDWLQGLFPPIRDSLDQYVTANRIQPHSHKHNLLSSWMLCANL